MKINSQSIKHAVDVDIFFSCASNIAEKYMFKFTKINIDTNVNKYLYFNGEENNMTQKKAMFENIFFNDCLNILCLIIKKYC
jgi:hypothetical protein